LPQAIPLSAAQHLDRSVEELDFRVRRYNCLRSGQHLNHRELVPKSENEMLRQNFGRKSLNEIKDIREDGLSPGNEFEAQGRIIWPPLPSQPPRHL